VSEKAEEYYRAEAGQRYQREKRAVPDGAFPWLARLRAEKFQAHIKAPDTVLELGAGLGWNLAALRCSCRIATDLENFLAPLARESGVEFLLSSGSLQAGSIDVVICHHVLEHVVNPPAMLAEARRLLKDGGLLFLQVPYEKERRYRRFNPAEPNHHLYSWNVQTLGNLLISQGFELQEVRLGQFGYDRFAAKWAFRFGLGEKGFRCVRFLAHLLRPGLEVRAICSKPSPKRS
jgi:SAM-dependent methyltransferase